MVRHKQGLVNLIWNFSFFNSCNGREMNHPFSPCAGKAVWTMVWHHASPIWRGGGLPGTVGSIDPPEFTSQFQPLYPLSSPGTHSGVLPPTKWWGNFAIWELKPLWERKTQGGGWSSSDLMLGSSGFLRRALVPQYRKGSEKRAYVTSQHIPESLALSKHQRWDCFCGPMESGQFERGHLYTGLERQVQGWKFWGITVRLFFNLVHLYYCITLFPKTG